MDSKSKKKKLKILAMPSNDGAIGELRMLEPLEEMESQGLIEKPCIIPLTDKEAFTKFVKDPTKIVMETDIIWFQAVLSQQFLMLLLDARMANPNIKIVMDVDDNIFAINPWNPVYGTFALENPMIDGKEFKLPLSRNLIHNRLFQTILMETDAIVTTTNILAAKYSGYNDNIWAMTNSLYFKNWDLQHVKRRPGKEVRLGWQGGTTHSQDWLQCHSAIKSILQKNKETRLEWTTSPMLMENFIKEFPKKRFTLNEFKHYDSHSWRQNALRPDIGLAPLNNDEFSICKSDLKTSEYAAMGIPVVASDITPYNKGVIHGETGFLAKNEKEWSKYLNLLIKDEELRLKMGANAYAWASENRCLEKNVPKWVSTFEEIMEVDNKWQIPQEVST